MTFHSISAFSAFHSICDWGCDVELAMDSGVSDALGEDHSGDSPDGSKAAARQREQMVLQASSTCFHGRAVITVESGSPSSCGLAIYYNSASTRILCVLGLYTTTTRPAQKTCPKPSTWDEGIRRLKPNISLP